MCYAGNQNQNQNTQQGNKLEVTTVMLKENKICRETSLYAESGSPPLKEYKQSWAEHKQVLILIPLKEKF